MSPKLKHYDRVQRYVACAEERIAWQREVVQGLRLLGAPADEQSDAQYRLRVTTDALLVMRQQLRMIEDQLIGGLHRLDRSR